MITLIDFHNLVETDELEFKAAQGQNGKGEVPKDFWETYSAFANTNGGTAILGIRENRDGSWDVLGIQDIQKVQKTLWDLLNDKNKININLLSNKDVRVENIEGKDILVITIPRATRQQRPVYTGTNPLTGTFRRNGEGDYRCDETSIQRMFAEAEFSERDTAIIEGFGISDLEETSIRAYRNIFASLNPTNEAIQLDDEDFLYRLHVFSEDRTTQKRGLTLAGLLMFGKERSIYDEIPDYRINFFEYGDDTNDWIDRVSNDGTWSGNLFDFYRRVYSKLVQDVKIPFMLDEYQRRIDDTPIHKALREAFTNTVVHADYRGSVGISIKKYRDRFEFANPGMSRVPIDYHRLYRGGQSDCRNPALQRMFRFIGAGEQAGSGLPRISRAWKEQHYYPPEFTEFSQPEYCLLRLPVVSLIADEITNPLSGYFGEKYHALSADERMALAIAYSEDKVTNIRLQQVSESHPRDLTMLLQDLVQQGYLEAEGKRRGTFYHLPRALHLLTNSPLLGENSPLLGENSPLLGENSPLLGENSPLLNENSPLLNENSPLSKQGLYEIATIVRNSKKVSKKEVQQTIFTLCANTWLQLSEIAELLGRDAKYVQEKYLTFMVRQELLQMKFPNTPNHPQQQYKAVLQANEDSNNFTLFP
ncbi:MAG: putative DNA binding domain-containing protein [Candidatus Kapabacteria bacterium]|jgi:predicted HTH transcriptional regulator|nr:putative DNA binding domain-containing protein [Candidatus Kapabacteria bacterium]